ncbi:hypothetical protein Adt_41822 [Abeliophyllum distichum]|uniref:Uncharacterized protein n=1 Tax=Abeliophyllum distichum TaxID=126358 RepID=A0ABD1PTV5_9LAMI
MKKRGLEINSSDLLLCGLLNSADHEVSDQVMSRVIRSSLDTLERRMEKKKKKSNIGSSFTGLVDPSFSFHDLLSETKLPKAISQAPQKLDRPSSVYGNDCSIVLTFHQTLLHSITQVWQLFVF